MCNQRIIAPDDSLVAAHLDIAKKTKTLAMSSSQRGGSERVEHVVKICTWSVVAGVYDLTGVHPTP